MHFEVNMEELTKAGVTKEEVSRLEQKEKQLEEQIRKFKEVVEAGTVRDSSTGNDILLMRIKSYEQKLVAMEALLKKQGKIADRELQLFGDNEWYEKYQQLAKEFERYKQDYKTPGEQTKTKKPAEIIEIDKEQRNRLDNMSSGVSNLGL